MESERMRKGRKKQGRAGTSEGKAGESVPPAGERKNRSRERAECVGRRKMAVNLEREGKARIEGITARTKRRVECNERR